MMKFREYLKMVDEGILDKSLDDIKGGVEDVMKKSKEKKKEKSKEKDENKTKKPEPAEGLVKRAEEIAKKVGHPGNKKVINGIIKRMMKQEKDSD